MKSVNALKNSIGHFPFASVLRPVQSSKSDWTIVAMRENSKKKRPSRYTENVLIWLDC